MGRKGDGPGEFRHLTWIGAIGGDSIFTYDSGHDRVSVSSADGRYLASWRVGLGLVGLWRRVAGPARGGDLCFALGPAPGFGPVSPGRGCGSIRVLRFDRATGDLDTMRTDPGQDAHSFVLSERPHEIWIQPVPFCPDGSFAAGPDRLAFGDAAYPGTLITDEAGRPELEIHLGLAARRPTRRGSERMIEHIRATGPEGFQERRDRFTGLVAPRDTLPFFSGLPFDRSGLLWVRLYSFPWEETTTLVAFDREGRAIRTVRLPTDVELLDIGSDHALALRRDSLGVESVVLMRLAGRKGGPGVATR